MSTRCAGAWRRWLGGTAAHADRETPFAPSSGLPALNRSAATAHHRVRAAMYALLLATAMHALFAGWQAERSEALRAAGAEALTLAAGQRWISQRTGRLVVMIERTPASRDEYAHALRDVVERSDADVQRLDALFADARVLRAEEPAQGAALAAWRETRARLRDTTLQLLERLEAGDPQSVSIAVTGAQAQSDRAFAGAQALVDALNAEAHRRHAQSLASARTWSIAMLLLLAALAIAVAEPTARAVRRQYRRLVVQAREVERLALVAELTTNAVLITDAARRITWVNDAFGRITGHGRRHSLGRRVDELFDGRHGDARTLARLREAIDHGEGIRTSIASRTRDGDELWLDVDIQPLRGEDGQLTGFVGIAADITERRRAQAEQRIAAIAFDASDAVAITDRDQVILKVNAAFTRITGYAAHEAIGRVTGRLLKSGRHGPEFYAAMWQRLRDDRRWQGEVWNRRKNGEIYPQWLSITAVTDDGGEVTHYVAVFSDITEKKQADEIIHRLAFYDPLTELPNRRLLVDRLGQALAASARQRRPAAVLFIDLDQFKALNDTRGHDVGDLLLVEVAQRLRASVRANDTVARQGGDEFVVILDDLAAQPALAAVQAEAVAEKVRAALTQPYPLPGGEYAGAASIGISLSGGHETTVEDLLKRADTAMYEAKRSGRNAIRFFDPATHAAMQERLTLEADLRHALAEGQLSLHYQAQVGRDARVFGVEALLRWRHPQRGMVPPAQFIAVAEDSELIVQIDAWVLECACRQLQAWSALPHTRHLHLAVNVSARQFCQPDFVDQVLDVLERTGADPHRLKLELTESLVHANVDDAVAKMRALKDLGVRFSVDDFGTGQSSLAYLTRLPLDEMKIDRSFVGQLGASKPDAVMVQTMIGMARNLGLGLVAEGVETEAQRRFLEDNGCERFQGYLFGKPVAADALDAWLFAGGVTVAQAASA